jgi:ppGpp synthetase/RelA/SpoT-type nucleotidyltranferase
VPLLARERWLSCASTWIKKRRTPSRRKTRVTVMEKNHKAPDLVGTRVMVSFELAPAGMLFIK